jgi:hypothetical protein
MINYEYKCVPVSDVYNSGTIGKDSHISAVKSYESKINESAKDGWELVMIDSVTSTQKPGCLAGLFGSKDVAVTFKLLVFRKPKVQANAPISHGTHVQ